MRLIKCSCFAVIMGSLSKDDGHGSENDTKTVCLDWQNNNCARDHVLLYIWLPSLHDYDVKLPNFTFYGGREHMITILYISLCELRYSPLEFSLRTADAFPVVASLPPKIAIFRRERSDDRKCVCCSQAI